MSHARRNAFIPALFLLSLVWAYREYIPYALWTLLLVAAVWITRKASSYICSHMYRHSLKAIDSMDGIRFEEYIAEVLSKNDYRNVSLTERYDYGVDIVAEKDGIRWGIQVKRYSGLVKADAVRQVVTGLRLYGCDRAIVITNSRFSEVAKRLAEGNNCILIDRSGLYSMMH